MKLTDRSDEWLLRAWSEQKDDAALTALMNRHWERVFRVAMRLLRDPHLAEDVAQETFVKVAQQAHRFERDRAFAPWLYAMTLNAARNAARARARRARHEAVVGERRATAVELPVETGSVEDHLRQLPDDLRDVLVLRYGEELTLEEVASTIGCPVGTASSRIRRGLDKLRGAGVGLSALTGWFALPVTPSPAAPSGTTIATIAARAAATRGAGKGVLALAGATLATIAALSLAVVLGGDPVPPAVIPPPLGGAGDSSAPAAVVTSAQLAAVSTAPNVRAIPVADGDPAPTPPAARSDAPAVPAAPADGRHVALVVADEDGRPLDDARVAVFDHQEGTVQRVGPLLVVRSRTDGRVALDLSGVRFPLKLVVTAEGRRPLVLRTDVAPTELRLRDDPARVEGQVLQRGTSQPIEGAVVVVEQDGVLVDVTTGPTGHFVAADLAPGRARLRVELDDLVAAERSVAVGDGVPVVVEVDRGATLVVRAQDPRGDPLAFLVEVAPEGGMLSMPTWRDGVGELVEHLSPGRYRVAIERPHPGVGMSGIFDATFDVTLAPGERRVVSATIDATQDGQVDVLALDGAGRPLADAGVTLRRAGQGGEFTGLGRTGRSDADGRAHFAVPPGRYEVELPDGAVKSEPLEVATTAQREVTLSCRGDRRLAGRVLDDAGAPLADAQVSFYGVAPGPGGERVEVTTRSDDDGSFALAGLPEVFDPAAHLMVFAEEFEPASVPLAGLRVPDVEVRLSRAAPEVELVVALRAAPGVVLPASITVILVGETWSQRRTVNDRLEVPFEAPPGARARLFVHAPGLALHRGPDVEIGRTPRVEVVLPAAPGRALTGRVVDPSGHPIAGASVLVEGLWGICDDETDADGRFALRDGPIEAYEVTVTADGFARQSVRVGTTVKNVDVVLQPAPR